MDTRHNTTLTKCEPAVDVKGWPPPQLDVTTVVLWRDTLGLCSGLFAAEVESPISCLLSELEWDGMFVQVSVTPSGIIKFIHRRRWREKKAGLPDPVTSAHSRRSHNFLASKGPGKRDQGQGSVSVAPSSLPERPTGTATAAGWHQIVLASTTWTAHLLLWTGFSPGSWVSIVTEL
ncbi:hypothetical protein TgHK011_006602 [Trichoderma gracile]|nr:hypothetical protein TgHK011_006602 [Trichoderma gracile]